MRLRLLALAGMLLFSHAHAADQLIRLPKPGELNASFNKKVIAAPIEPSSAPAAPGPSEVKAAPVSPLPAEGRTGEAVPAPVVVKETAVQKETVAVSAPAMPAATRPASKPAAEAGNSEEEDIQLLAERISARLAALRKERASAPPAAPPRKKNVAATKVSHAAANDAHQHWRYEGEGGPSQWGGLNPAWAKCASGTRQSPIDIRDGLRVDLEPIGFDYKPARFSVTDTGHTIQVNVTGGNTITVTGRTYELTQFHFHLPSEERINGKSFPMVAHLVHKDATGRLAMVAILIEEGNPHGTVQQVWNNLPLERAEPVMATTALDLAGLLPARREYYTYMGSLTTPPCSEGVLWIVMKEPITLSSQQIAIFSRLYPMNARPIQAQAGRLIKESN